MLKGSFRNKKRFIDLNVSRVSKIGGMQFWESLANPFIKSLLFMFEYIAGRYR